jgi:hypothetical protein
MPRCVRAHAVFELGKAGGIAARPSFQRRSEPKPCARFSPNSPACRRARLPLNSTGRVALGGRVGVGRGDTGQGVWI